MIHRGILIDSRKGNISNINVSLDPLAGVKHSTTTQMSTSAPPAAQDLGDNTGLALDPMMSPTYLSSPLDTILESMHDPHMSYVSLHDLIEAYSVLSARIRAQFRIIIHHDTRHTPLPALSVLAEHASPFSRALMRDVYHALTDPLQSLRDTPYPGESSSSLMLSMSETDIQYARDLATLCHHALRVLSGIFVLKPLYSLFTEQDIQDLLDELLKIALAPSLPTPHANKTWSLVFWTMGVQTLPLSILSPRITDIVKALKRSILDERGVQAKLDSFEVVHNMVKRHPGQFISHLVELLPLVLHNLASESGECRFRACHALGGFALAKMDMTSASSPKYPHEAVVKTLRAFIERDSSTQHPSPSQRRTQHLSDLLIHAFSSSGADSPQARTQSKRPSWAVVLLASFILLSDASVFFHAKSLRFVLAPLRHASRHTNKDIRAAHAVVWRVLVWAFGRVTAAEWGVRRRGDGDGGRLKVDARDAVFRTVVQEVKGGIGVALATLLLGPSEGEGGMRTERDVGRGLVVVKEMVCGKAYADPREGVVLLSRIVGAIGTPPCAAGVSGGEWKRNVEPVRGLFDGTVGRAELGELGTALSELGGVDVERVRQLAEDELVEHWDGLVEIWIEGIEGEFRDSTGLSGDILHIWQSLLLVQAHLTQEQEHSHLTASSNFARRVASIVVRFLVHVDDKQARLQRIVFVQRLWGVMKNVFASAWLPPPAEIILAGLLKLDPGVREEGDRQEEVKGAWSRLCADLVDVGIPTILHIVNVRSACREGLEVTRLLWAVLARALEKPDEYVHWDDVVCFLVIPLKSWVMSDSELRIWDSTLRKAVSMAGAIGTNSTEVARRMFNRMEDEKAKLDAFPEAVVILLSHVDLSDADALPVDIFSMVDAVLVSVYPPQPESLESCLKTLRHVGEIIISTPPSLLVQLLTTLEESLRLWIGDYDEVMSESEFNGIVNDVYCRALDSLRVFEPSLETLLAISPFLATAFVRMPPPAIGPMSFESFWRGTYHELLQYRPFYPDCLKACLMGFADVCGGSLGGGLSMGTETQATHMSTVPDSQPPHVEVANNQLEALEEGSSRYPVFDPEQLLSSEPPKRCLGPSPTPGSSSDMKGPIRHYPDHMAALQQLNDYESMRSLEEPSGSIHTGCQPDNLTPLRSSPPPTSTASEFWRRDQEKTPSPSRATLPSSSDVDLRDLILASSPPTNERKRPFDPGVDTILHSSFAGSLVQQSVVDRPPAKRRKTDSGIHFERSLARSNRRAQSESDVPEPCAASLAPTSSLPMKNELSSIESWKASLGRKRLGQSSSPAFRGGDPPGTSFRADGTRVSDDRHEMSPSPLEDYDTWEASVSIEETRKLRKELVESDRDFDTIETADDGAELSEETDALSPLLMSTTIRKQTRSRTAPGSIPLRPLPTPLLRRYQTVGASTRMDALRRAYTAVVNDESQVAVEDLIQATALVNRIGTKLNEQMERRIKTAGRNVRVTADPDEHWSEGDSPHE